MESLRKMKEGGWVECQAVGLPGQILLFYKGKTAEKLIYSRSLAIKSRCCSQRNCVELGSLPGDVPWSNLNSDFFVQLLVVHASSHNPIWFLPGLFRDLSLNYRYSFRFLSYPTARDDGHLVRFRLLS